MTTTAGDVLVETFTTATCGTGCRGTYRIAVPYEVDHEQEGTIVVHDRSGEDIGRLVAEHRLVISELSPISSSLEEIFFQLTVEPGTVG